MLSPYYHRKKRRRRRRRRREWVGERGEGGRVEGARKLRNSEVKLRWWVVGGGGWYERIFVTVF